MTSAQPFVVPEGVIFQIESDGVVIENRGDIVLHTNFGRPLKRVVSAEGSIEVHAAVTGGVLQAALNITIHGSLQADGKVQAGGNISVEQNTSAPEIEAGGTLHIGGVATVGTLRGNAVHLVGAQVTARGVQGWSQVVLGEGKVQIDAVLAPDVTFSPRTSGRVTVVESGNELVPSAVKGCFRLADYAEMFGDPNAFLAERGLMRLAEAPAGQPVVAIPAPAPVVSSSVSTAVSASVSPAVSASVSVPPPPPVGVVTAAPVSQPPAATPSQSLSALEAAPEPRSSIPPKEEPDHTDERAPTYTGEDGSMNLPEIEVEATMDVVPARPVHPSHAQVERAVAKVLEAYAGAEVPPAVERLHSLVEQHSYDTIRTEITNIWQDLLRFHQKKGLRLPPAVTTTFNTINSIVKKM